MPVSAKNDGLKLLSSAIVDSIKGLKITIKSLFKPAITLQYPDERDTLPERTRGILYQDTARCTACGMCAKACPVECIKVESIRGEDGKRRITKYEINIFKCLFCGLCTEVCPTKCLTMTGGYEKAVYDRGELILRFVEPGKEVFVYVPQKQAESTAT